MSKREKHTPVRQALNTVLNILSWTALAILIVIAAFLVYYVITTKIHASRGEKFEPPLSLYTIISPSMEPNINVYDVIVDVRVTDPKTIKKGDVITFISSSSISSGFTVTHRVIDIVEDENGIRFKTKGDNNITPDSSMVAADNILGKVLFKIPQLGRVQELLSNRMGWIMIVLIPALLIIAYDVAKLFKLAKVKDKVETAAKSDEIIITEEQIQKEMKRKAKLKEKLLAPITPRKDVEDYVDTKPANKVVRVGDISKPITIPKPKKTNKKVELDLPTPRKKTKTSTVTELPKKKTTTKKTKTNKKKVTK